MTAKRLRRFLALRRSLAVMFISGELLQRNKKPLCQPHKGYQIRPPFPPLALSRSGSSGNPLTMRNSQAVIRPPHFLLIDLLNHRIKFCQVLNIKGIPAEDAQKRLTIKTLSVNR